MPTLAIERLFKIAQYRNIFIAGIGLDHCLKIPIAPKSPLNELPTHSQRSPGRLYTSSRNAFATLCAWAVLLLGWISYYNYQARKAGIIRPEHG